ncbi:uncharacterized protein LOC144928819 [Branchiostoma floridae x Branchiostoma belcheri]
MSDGSGEVDLRPLVSADPSFKDLLATTVPDDYLYSWNPCQSFTEGQCQNVAVCRKKTDGSEYEDLGTQDNVEISASQDPDTGETSIEFGYRSLDGQRSSVVIAKCTTGQTNITAEGEKAGNYYVFDLSSPCACPGAGPDCAGEKPVTCNQTGPCSCRMSDGSGEINLQFLLSGNPTFRDYNSTIFPDGFLYSWNPCEPFSEGSCKDVAVGRGCLFACKSAGDGSEYADIGKQDSVQISGGKDASSGDVVISLAYLSADGDRASTVVATCTTGDTTTFTAEGQTTENSYTFQLESPCACPNTDPECARGKPPTCEKTGPCSCRMSDGSGEVNLRPLLAGNQIPTFKDVPEKFSDEFLYSWNPCEPFNEGSCEGVALCQKKNGSSEYYDLGRHDSVEIQADLDPINGLTVSFRYTSADGERSSLIITTCNSDDETQFTADGEDLFPNSYLFYLNSSCACPGADADCAGYSPTLAPNPPPGPGLSAGAVVLIIAVSAFAGYFLVGAIFNKVIRGKQGSEVIPNVQFWKNLPDHIKSGVFFIISPCRRTAAYKEI